MFHHLLCHGNVVIKLQDSLEFGADNFQLDLRNGTVRISSMIVVQNRNVRKIPIVFYCTHCEHIIEDAKEIGCNCSYCGKAKCAEEMFIRKGDNIVCALDKKKLITRDDVPEKEFISLMELFKDGITPPV
jgi:hypothetical protein